MRKVPFLRSYELHRSSNCIFSTTLGKRANKSTAAALAATTEANAVAVFIIVELAAILARRAKCLLLRKIKKKKR